MYEQKQVKPKGGNQMVTQIETPIRIGLIGCGGISQKAHFPALEIAASMDLVQISAIADPIEANLSAIGDRANLSSGRRHANYRDMLAAGGLDLVIVATPHHLHAEHTTEALSSRVAVISEKPMATRLEEADRILELADRNRVLYTAVHNFLFSAVSQEAIRLLSEELGDRVFGRSKSLFAKSTSATDQVFWRNRKDAGGGCLADTCYHEIYLLENMIGSPVRYVEGRIKTKFFNFDVDDVALLLLEHENGAVSTVMTSWGASSGAGDQGNICEVHTQGDGLRLISRGQSLYRFLRSNHQWQEIQVADYDYITPEAKAFAGHTGYFMQTFQALANGTKIPITGQQARQNLAIIEGARRASIERKAID